jgi:hypothetical protein
MWWLWTVALATEATELAELRAEIEAMDGHIDAAAELYGAAGEIDASVEPARAQLEEDAVAVRAVTKKLHILEGRARNAGKKGQDDLVEVEALRTLLSAQHSRRQAATKLLAGKLALAGAGDDARAWIDANTQLSGAARVWSGGPTDSWVVPFVTRAMEAEKWGFAAGAAHYCVATCADPAVAKAALEKIPEGQRPDARWVAAANAQAPDAAE